MFHSLCKNAIVSFLGVALFMYVFYVLATLVKAESVDVGVGSITDPHMLGHVRVLRVSHPPVTLETTGQMEPRFNEGSETRSIYLHLRDKLKISLELDRGVEYIQRGNEKISMTAWIGLERVEVVVEESYQGDTLTFVHDLKDDPKLGLKDDDGICVEVLSVSIPARSLMEVGGGLIEHLEFDGPACVKLPELKVNTSRMKDIVLHNEDLGSNHLDSQGRALLETHPYPIEYLSIARVVAKAYETWDDGFFW